MPRVSIGIPVYNGQHYLGEAIDAILTQTFKDFELIICDNASLDDTEKICRKYAAFDRRIRYYRNEKNIGPAHNFNLVYKYASGEFFKWAAHDDLLAPTFLEKCVEVLGKRSDVVIAYPKAMIIDLNSQEVGPYKRKLDTNSNDIVRRFHVLLKGHACYEIFGLIRRNALEKTPLMGLYAHGDGVLLSRLALLGRFEEIPEYLFFPREHPNQSMSLLLDRQGTPTSQEYRNYAMWFDPELKGKKLFPYWKLSSEYFRSLRLVKTTLYNRLRFYKHILNWMMTKSAFLFNEIIYYFK